MINADAARERERYERQVAESDARDAERGEQIRMEEIVDELALQQAREYEANRQKREQERIDQEPPGEVVGPRGDPGGLMPTKQG